MSQGNRQPDTLETKSANGAGRNTRTKSSVSDVSFDGKENANTVTSDTALKGKTGTSLTAQKKSNSERNINTEVTKLDVSTSKNNEMHKSYNQGYQKQNGYRVEQRNFLSHSEFPDIKSAGSMNNKNQIGKSFAANGQMRNSTNKVAKFKPFDPNCAPTNFRNCSQNVRSQNFNHYNTGMTTGPPPVYPQQGQAIYQYIPPQQYVQVKQPAVQMVQMNMTSTGSSATAVAPNGEKIFIPLDDSRYEIKRSNHDLYDMPQDCDLYPLSSEGNFESNVHLHSPRPIDIRGSLSDEWSGSSQDGPYSETESEHETELETETDTSEVANNFVAEVLKTITERVDNLAVLSNDNEESLNVETRKTVDSASCDRVVNDNEVTKDVPDKCFEGKKDDNNGCENNVQPGKHKETDTQNIESSSSETEDSINSKRVKVDKEVKSIDEKKIKTDQLCAGSKENKKSKSKRPRPWKENRKNKQYRTKTKNKQEINEESASEENVIFPESKQDTENLVNDCGSCPANRSSVNQDEKSNTTTDSQKSVVIDGQGYFKSNELQNSQYHPYYIPDAYTFVQNQYQQYQYSAAPEYTMFIHDACAPPAKDEVFTEVHKSISGELINNQAQAYQMPDGVNRQQTIPTIYDNADNNSAQKGQVHNYTVETVQPTGQYEHYGPTYAASPYTMTTGETQPSYNQFSSGVISNPYEQQSGGQGQIYISYDEDSVYVDPESGLSYPALHMTDDFLITVIFREGVFLEITADKGLRLVNHEKKLVVAINENGNKACVIHPAARIYQSDTSLHAELYSGRRAKMTDELTVFGNKLKTYKFDHRIVTEMTEEPAFRDLSQDDSVSFLPTDSFVGNEDLKLKMEEILSYAHFWKNGTCGSTVIINSTKVVQNEQGDVSVYRGPINFLRMNPEKMILRLKTQFIEVDIETNWNVKITRGPLALNASHMSFIVSNGKIKACLDSNNKLQSFSVPDHRVLMLGQPISQHRPGVPGSQRSRTPHRKTEPEGDHHGYARRSPNDDQSLFRDWEEGWDSEFNNQNYHKRWDPEAGRWVYPVRQQYWRDYC